MRDNEFVVSNDVLFFAFRYALGRRTAAVSTMVSALLKHWPRLSEADRRMVKRDIRRAIKIGDAGADCDVAEWQKVLAVAEGTSPWQA